MITQTIACFIPLKSLYEIQKHQYILNKKSSEGIYKDIEKVFQELKNREH